MANNLVQSPVTNRGLVAAARRPGPAAALHPPSEIMLAIVNRVQHETGATFSQGWELARAIFPTVFNSNAARPVPLAGMAQMLQGSALTTAVALANRKSHLAMLTTSTKASPRIFNRAPEAGDLGRGVAQLRAPDALARLQGEGLDTGSLFPGDWRESLCATFKQALAALMETNHWTLAEAFHQLRDAEPAFWTSAVLVLCDYEPSR